MEFFGILLIVLAVAGLVILAAVNDWFQAITFAIAGIWCMIIWPILKYPPLLLGVLLFMLAAGVLLVII